jgi:hypothetical protein
MSAIDKTNIASAKAHSNLIRAIHDAGSLPAQVRDPQAPDSILNDILQSIKQLTTDIKAIPDATIEKLTAPAPVGHDLLAVVQNFHQSIGNLDARVGQLIDAVNVIVPIVGITGVQMQALHQRLVDLETAPAEGNEVPAPAYAADQEAGQAGLGGHEGGEEVGEGMEDDRNAEEEVHPDT